MKLESLLARGILISLALTNHAAHANSVAQDLVGELQAMRSVYSAVYAPADWKRTYANYDLDTEFNQAIEQANANPNLSLREAKTILMNFIYAMKDYHVSISFQSTEVATLPLSIKGTDSKFFIVYVDRAKLPLASFPFNVGDEVVTFGGIPTSQALAAVQAEVTANVPSTDKALAEINLTRRRASRGYAVPQGPITLGIKRAGSDEITTHQLIWDYTPERIQPRRSFGAMNVARSSLLHPQMDAKITDVPTANPHDVGGRKTFTPALGVKVWESAETDFFHAYMFKTADRKLMGYIRIASYGAPDYVKAVSEFSRVMSLFESTTDGLVIDQVNNPGGSVFYLYALASMLAKQPLITPRHRMAITQADVAESLNAISELEGVKTDEDAKKAMPGDYASGYPISYEFAQFTLNYARFIVNEWNQGKKLSDPYWIAGVDHINPSDVHYSKPILLLTNALDFSGGDFFPAILQDNRRVTIFGSRTAGAGGYVNDIQFPNVLGVDSFRCTQSLAERVDQNPIENLGVTPDIAYTMSENDFTQNFREYTQAILTALNGITQ